MKKLLISVVIIAGIVTGGAFWYQDTRRSNEGIGFQLAEITRGDIENVVSSTGTLEAVGTVLVGSQISGTVDKVLVDYNDKVKKGQMLALVDTILLEASVRDAEAGVTQRRAQLEEVRAEYQRNETLYKQGYIPEMTFLAVQTSVKTAQASLVSAEAVLKRAQTNLKYAEIRSPIDGTVIERSIEAGQTISASMSAPTLFTIAEDLARMQIEAAVDESDIGQIKQEMLVRFTVQAYPEELFNGAVRQIRLKPTITQDVVNYTVIVDAPNESGLLLPGMTATVDFLVEERKDVLLIPNTAMYFKPSEDMLAQVRKKRTNNTAAEAQEQPSGKEYADEQQVEKPAVDEQQTDDNQPRKRKEPKTEQADNQSADNQQSKRQRPDRQRTDKQRAERQAVDGKNPDRQGPGQQRSGSAALVFYLDADGTPAMARFMKGATNGIMTEVRRSQELEEGMQVIIGIKKEESSEKSGFTFPFLGGGRRGGL